MKKIFIVISMILLLASCTSTKEIAYFQDSEHGRSASVAQKQITLRPEDKITILVNTRNQELTNMFNLPYVSRQLGTQTNYGQTQGVSCYTVDNEGNIDFPQLGKVHIAGMTRNMVAETIKSKLVGANLVKDPIVTVEFANLTFSVLGEVKNPNRYPIDRDAITILDAISRAGDLTIHGLRTNVKVLRMNEDGTQKSYIVNLCSLEELQNSPVFYLQQNDVVYVEPNEMRARQSTVNGNNVRSSSFWISLASLLTSVTLIFVK